MSEQTPEQLAKQNELLKQRIELEKEMKKLKGESVELTKEEISEQRLILALEAERQANAGDMAAAFDAYNKALKAVRDTEEALNAEEKNLQKLREEALKTEGERLKQVQQEIKEAENKIATREQEKAQFDEIIVKLREETKEYRLLSDSQRKNSKDAEGFLSSMTYGLLKSGMATKNVAFRFGDLTKRMLTSTEGVLEFSLAFKNVVNVQNLATAAFNTVAKATLSMATQFDNASAKFAATTGLANSYNDVLIKVQKQGNRFGITAAEGGEAMAGLLAGFNDFHRSAPGVQKDLTLGVASLGKLGVSAKQSTDMLNNMNKFMGMSGTEALAASKKIGMMGTKIGITTSKMLSDYDASLKTLAVYGDKSIDVFTGIAAAAKAAGVETGTLLGMVEKFDTFAGAAEGAGKLNSILGSQLSATEMLMMTEDERIKTLISTTQATGQSFGSMDKFTQKAIANAAGITDMAEANKIFGMSMSEYENYEAQMKQSTNAQAEFDKVMKDVTPTLEKLKLILGEFAVAFAPALEAMGTVLQFVLDGITKLDDFTKGYFGTIVGGMAGLFLFATGLGGIGKMLNFVSFGLLKNIGLLTKKAAASLYNATLGQTEIAQKITKLGLQAKEKVADLIDIGQKTTKNTLTQAQASAELRLQMVQRSKLKTQMLVNKATASGVGPMMAMGAAVLMIGGGIGLAALGMAEFVKAFANLTGEQLIAATVGIVAFTIAFAVLMSALIGLVTGPQGILTAAAVGVLLSVGAAAFMIGAGIGLAALGLATFIDSMAGLEKIAGLMGALSGTADIAVDLVFSQRMGALAEFLDKVDKSDIKAELENIALITTGKSASLMTKSSVTQMQTINSLADQIKNVFNADIVIKIDGDAMDGLIEKGVYKTSMGNK